MHFDTKKNFKVPEIWVTNVIKNCGVDHLVSHDPEVVNFENLIVSLSIIGSYLGVILE